MSEPLERLTAALADRYRIERELGAGGMATVYLAEDLKHHRQVALKVLRHDLAVSLGPGRFLREVSIAANLQHPHILPLYDSGEVDGILFYVMPYVPGPSLRQKLVREGELPIADAVRILRDVADAMAYAHAHHVVHRDIKPENVMLADRHAVVTDFGVAKAVSDATGAHTLTTAGVALGTPTYMAPEQATADPHADHRCDIYAWGVMAYELLTGRPPFTGSTPQAVLGAHVTLDPDPVTRHRTSIPPVLATVVMKALEKKPADRWQSAQELIGPLEAILTPSGGITPAETPPLARSSARRLPGIGHPAVLAIAALALVGSGIYGGRLIWGGQGPVPDGPPTRFTIPVASPQLDQTLGQLPLIAIAPDGRSIVYADSGGLRLRGLASFDARVLDGTANAVAPAFSPGGDWLVFSQAGRIRKLAVAGGQVVDVATANYRLGAAWSADGQIYFSAGLGDRGIWRVPAAGGTPEQVTRLVDSTREQAHGWPQVLPGGRDLIYTVLGPSGHAEDSRIVVERLGSGIHRTLIERAAFARYLPTGHLLYGDINGALFAVGYQAGADVTTGTPVPVLDQRVSTAVWGGRAVFDISSSGVLVFVPETTHDNHRILSVNRSGQDQRAIGRARNLRGMAIGPQGGSLASTVREPGKNDVWLLATAGDAEERLTLDVAEDEMPAWSPDGRRIAYGSAWAGQARRIMVTDVVARQTPQVLRTWSRHIHPTSWSPDGKWLASYDYHPTNNEDVWAVGVEGADSLAVAIGPASELNPAFSPDGRWLAYQSSESGQYEVYVAPFPTLSGKRQVSTGGGAYPKWDPDGTGLYFLRGRQVMEVKFSGPDLVMRGQAQPVFELAVPPYEIDLDPATGRFVLLMPNTTRVNPSLHVVLNWFRTLTAPAG